jgi:hypothetical protein
MALKGVIMPIRITCTCGRAYQIKDKFAGRRAKCPACGAIINIPHQQTAFSADKKPVSKSNLSGHNVVAAASDTSTSRLSSEEPIPKGMVADQEAANAELAHWKEQLPEAKPAYKASGKVPVLALVIMLFVLPFAAVAGSICGSLLNSILLIPLGIIGGLIVFLWWRITPYFAVMCLAPVLVVIGGLIGGVIYLVTAGAVAAIVVANAGKLGKNRSPVAAGVFSLVAAALLVGSIWMLFRYVPDSEVHNFITGPWGILCTIVAGLVACVTAAATGYRLVEEQRFCEKCKCYLTSKELKPLSYFGTLLAVKAIKSENLSEVQHVIAQNSGERGLPMLYACPQCGSGYLDLSVKFNATWRTGNTENPTKKKSESWLVASVPVDQDTSGDLAKLVSVPKGSRTGFVHNLKKWLTLPPFMYQRE